jgi:hypothetical protein
MYSVFRGTEEYDLRVMLLEARTYRVQRLSYWCSRDQLTQPKGTCQDSIVNIVMSLK